MTIWVPVLRGAGPKYRQLADAIARAVETGELTAREKLPPQRTLAHALGVTTGTVTRAYGQAEQEGWVRARVGSGTYVRSGSSSGDHAFGLAPGVGEPNGPLDMGLALPPASSERENGLRRALAVVSSRADTLRTVLDYLPAAGQASHRSCFADWLGDHGRAIDPDELIVNLGGMNGIALSLAALLKAGDRLAVARLTYPGVVSLAQQLHLKTVALPLDDEGIDIDAVASRHQQQPFKALYVMPEHQNPTTAQLTPARRHALASLARRLDFWLIEDDVLPVARSSRLAALYEYAPERTIYLTSVSKLLGGGMRSGAMRVPESLMPRIQTALRNQCWMPPPLMVELVCEWIRSGDATRLAAWQAKDMAARHALAREMLQGIAYQGRAEGFYIWLRLPPGQRAAALAAQLAREQVVVTPSEAFCAASEPAPQAIRICISSPATHERLAEGLARVRAAIEQPDPMPWQTV